MVNVRLSKYLNFNADCQYLDGMNRFLGDPRDDPSIFTWTNATLIVKKFLKGYEGLELRGSVYNLFDKDWSSPTSIEIPHDWPVMGIHFMLEMKYSF